MLAEAVSPRRCVRDLERCCTVEGRCVCLSSPPRFGGIRQVSTYNRRSLRLRRKHLC